MDAQRRKTAVATLSVISNTILVGFKLVIGLAIGSVSVISEAIHSGVDLLAAVVALFAVRTAAKPSDEDHAFGHGKIENISGTIEALLIFVAAVWIVIEAVRKLRHGTVVEEPGLGVAVMLGSSIVNLVVSQMLLKVGRQTESIALQADAWHLRTDVYTSAGVMVGLGSIWLGRRLLPGLSLNWLDPVSALAVALLIMKAAVQLTRESARDLLDARLPRHEEDWIRRCVADQRGGVHSLRALRTRKSGANRFVEIDLLVDGDISVEAAHQIADEIEHSIRGRFPGATTTIHVEPCDANGHVICRAGCEPALPPAPP
jgi:cation diffusion facilitator family transporter